MSVDPPGPRRPGPVPYANEDRSHRAVVLAIAVAVVFVVVAAQNSRSVEVHLVVWHVRTPLYGLALVSALLGAIVIEATAGVRRHRNHLRDQEHRELLRLRRSRRATG